MSCSDSVSITQLAAQEVPARAEELVRLQKLAYAVEARLIGDDRIPQLYEQPDELVAEELTWLIATTDGEIVGALAFSVDDGLIDIERLVVSPDHHRRGIGKRLVCSVPPGRAVVSTGRDNAPARGLYGGLGFIHVHDDEVLPGLWISGFERALTPEERLAVLYDEDNPDGSDHEYFRMLATRLGARRITDLGCGTGILTVTLAGEGRPVLGIDPDEAMLNRARHREGGAQIEWRLGTSEQIAPDSADLVIMSGNVAMHILDDDWHQTLRDIAAGLVPEGVLAFETRNPLAEAWREWNSPMRERDTVVGRLGESEVTTSPDGSGVITMSCHNVFLVDGVVFDVEQKLQFRSLETVTADLNAAGLEVVAVWRDWTGTPFTNTAEERLMVFEARRP